jgi:hypothetical protein
LVAIPVGAGRRELAALRIFISYSHNDADTPLARYLAARFRELGFEVWQDESSQPAAGELQDDIEKAVRDSDHAVFIVSKLWLQSQWCRLELDRFVRRDPARVRRVPIFRLPFEQLLLPASMIGWEGITWVEDEPHHHERFWQVFCALSGRAPGPATEWGELGRGLTKSSVPPPIATTTTASLESLRCNRAVQWNAVFEVVPEQSHDIMFVPGVVGQAHDHFSRRVREMLSPVPPRSIVSVHWRKRPCTRDEFYAALADDLRVSPEWLPREIAERMSDSNLVLIHPCVRTWYSNPVLVSYYTDWLPQLIQQTNPRMSLKCVQPVEWPPEEGVLAKALALFRLRTAASEDGRPEAEKFMSAVQSSVAPAVRVIRLQDLADISDKDLEEFCQIERLTAPQKAWFLSRIKSRHPKTSQEIFDAIDAFLPDARSRV